MRSTLLVLILAAASVAADTEIHRCLLDDGTIAFQEMPCAEQAADANDGSESGKSRDAGENPAADDDVFDFVNPFDEPASAPATAKKQGQEYLAELLVLTQQLRGCKELQARSRSATLDRH